MLEVWATGDAEEFASVLAARREPGSDIADTVHREQGDAQGVMDDIV